jgi:CubicO group peptidase (beta-lactamase class C family)
MASQSVARSESIAAFIPDLELLIAEAMDEWKIPGLAFTVVQNGEVALGGAYGLRDVEGGLKVTTDTQFMICSITKSFTSTGLALLVDERRLAWKKPVRDYIPEFRLHDAVATDRITVRDLLCHHSGLPRHDWVHMLGPAKCSIHCSSAPNLHDKLSQPSHHPPSDQLGYATLGPALGLEHFMNLF